MGAILSTHHHYDHVGGNEALATAFKVPVYGGEKDKGQLAGMTNPLAHGDTVMVGSEQGKVLHIPGHTLGHIAYAFYGHVFTGDTLFFAGCGRLFEGGESSRVIPAGFSQAVWASRATAAEPAWAVPLIGPPSSGSARPPD